MLLEQIKLSNHQSQQIIHISLILRTYIFVKQQQQIMDILINIFVKQQIMDNNEYIKNCNLECKRDITKNSETKYLSANKN